MVLDATLHDVIVGAIDFDVTRREFAEAFGLLRLLQNSLIHRKEPGLVPQPIDVADLVPLMREFSRAPLELADPEATTSALVSALIAHDPTLALKAFEDACASGLEKQAPQLACIGFLQLATAFMALRNDKDMVYSFTRALMNLSRNTDELSLLRPLFHDFFRRLVNRPNSQGLADELLKKYGNQLFIPV